jgi:hypothetical protein
MPAPRARGGGRGGGIAKSGRFEALSQGSAEGQNDEDTVMRDREHAEKRKRDGQQGGAEDSPQRRLNDDSESTSENATHRKLQKSPASTRMTTRGIERARNERADSVTSQSSQGSQQAGSRAQSKEDAPQAATINDIMAFLLRTQKETREKEEGYKEEIKQLQSTVTALVVDLKSLQASVPNWGSLESALQSSSQRTGTTDSYASVASRGVALPEVEQVQTPRRSPGSRVSFDLSEQSDRSPIRSPPLSLGTTIRSAMRATAHARETDMIIDLKNLDMEGSNRVNQHARTKARIVAAIRSNDGLDGAELKTFKIRHTNEDVHLAYFKLEREAEKIARAQSREWIDMFLKGARLIEPTWYPIKVDFIDKLSAMDSETGGISEAAREAFSKETEVEVKYMRWLGRPKEHATYASAVVKLSGKDQVEKLLLNQQEGKDIFMFECTVQVSVFQDNTGPKACFRCQQYGHLKKDCRNIQRCSGCAQVGHERCESREFKCVNCNANHPSTSKKCPAYRKQQERIINLRPYD